MRGAVHNLDETWLWFFRDGGAEGAGNSVRMRVDEADEISGNLGGWIWEKGVWWRWVR